MVLIASGRCLSRRSNEDNWTVFYHVYSSNALLYEVNAAMANILFGYGAERAPLPRLLFHCHSDNADESTADEAPNMHYHEAKLASCDPHYELNAKSIKALRSLLVEGPEANIPECFVGALGQQQDTISHRHLLNELLADCGVPRHEVKRLGYSVVALAAKYGLDVRQFGGEASSSGRNAHLLQIFIRDDLLDSLSRQVDGSEGETEMVCEPETFMQQACVRMHVASADPTFHSNRSKFQKELSHLCSSILSNGNHRVNAVMGICSGRKATRWDAHEQHNLKLNSRYGNRSLSPPPTSRAVRASNRLQMGRQHRRIIARVPRRNARQRQMCV